MLMLMMHMMMMMMMMLMMMLMMRLMMMLLQQHCSLPLHSVISGAMLGHVLLGAPPSKAPRRGAHGKPGASSTMSSTAKTPPNMGFSAVPADEAFSTVLCNISRQQACQSIPTGVAEHLAGLAALRASTGVARIMPTGVATVLGEPTGFHF